MQNSAYAVRVYSRNSSMENLKHAKQNPAHNAACGLLNFYIKLHTPYNVKNIKVISFSLIRKVKFQIAAKRTKDVCTLPIHFYSDIGSISINLKHLSALGEP